MDASSNCSLPWLLCRCRSRPLGWWCGRKVFDAAGPRSRWQTWRLKCWYVDILRAAIEHGADASNADSQEHTALCIAAIKDTAREIGFLVEAGAISKHETTRRLCNSSQCHRRALPGNPDRPCETRCACQRPKQQPCVPAVLCSTTRTSGGRSCPRSRLRPQLELVSLVTVRVRQRTHRAIPKTIVNSETNAEWS